MPGEIVMPRMSDTMEEGRIVRWLKHQGDHIEKGDPLADVETDKAVMQLESYESGELIDVLVPEGESAPVGEPIARVGDSSEAHAGETPNIVRPKEISQARERPEAASEPGSSIADQKTPTPNTTDRVKASPLARRIAEERGVNLAAIKGSGPGGRIVQHDVESYLSHGIGVEQPKAEEAIAAPQTQPSSPEDKSEVLAGMGVSEIVELPRMRLAIGARMTQSKTTVPHFYVTVEIDMVEIVRLRRSLKVSWAPDEVGFNDFIVKAVALALRQFPDLNASYEEGRIRRHSQVNVGLAVAVPDGLFVPVIRDADQRTLREIAKESRELVQRARAGRAYPGDYGGSTFTITNLGMFDVEEFIAIITPPESAILAVGSIKSKPVVVDGQLGISDRMLVTLSGDHRVFDGMAAAQFLQELKRLLQDPLGLLR